jgi:hypothetical protein
LIVSSRPKTAIPSPPIVWIRVPTEAPTRPTEIWLGEGPGREVAPGADVIGLLERVIDRAEEELAAAGDPNAPLARPEGSGDVTRHEDRPWPDTEPDEVSSRRFSHHLFEERGLGIP